jgi:hypothetical protein
VVNEPNLINPRLEDRIESDSCLRIRALPFLSRAVISCTGVKTSESRRFVQVASGRVHMFESHAPEAPDQRNTEHELWLAMQTAYNKYMETSAALEVSVSRLQRAIPSADGSLGIEAAASEHRTAFENYIEARMQFAEFRCDRNNAGRCDLAGSGTGDDCTALTQQEPARRPWSGSKISTLALPAAVIALLCTTAFSLAYVARERRQILDSEAARDQVSAMLAQARDDIQSVVRKIDAVNLTPVTKAAGRARWRLIQTRLSAPQKRNHAAGTRQKLIHKVQNLAERSRWAFTLPVSRRFQSVGPLRLSLRLVSLKYRYFDLCVMNDNFKLQHVNLHEPVRITLSDPSRRLELVASRMDKNYVQGYLSALKYQKSDLTASQVRRKTSGGI